MSESARRTTASVAIAFGVCAMMQALLFARTGRPLFLAVAAFMTIVSALLAFSALLIGRRRH